MTAYHLTPTTTLPSLVVQEAKEKRKQVLAKAAQTRKANYQRFLKKQRLQASRGML
jgi:vacuolar-type H+-ATPase subunit H